VNVTTSNLVNGRVRRAAMVLLPTLLLPLSLAGVTVRPMLAFREAAAEAHTAERQAYETTVLREELRNFGSVEDLEYRAALVERASDALIPVDLQSLEVYSVVRSAASAAGFRLESLQVGDPIFFRDATRGRSIGRREIRVRARSSSREASEFVDRLRASGLPVAVQAYTFARRNGSAAYSADLLFDVFHHIPAVESTDDSPESMGLMDMLSQ
jgi:hypothetical protein